MFLIWFHPDTNPFFDFDYQVTGTYISSIRLEAHIISKDQTGCNQQINETMANISFSGLLANRDIDSLLMVPE